MSDQRGFSVDVSDNPPISFYQWCDIPVTFVLPTDAANESDASEAMIQVYKSCKHVVNNVSWAKESDLVTMNFTKRNYVVFENFEGKDFSKLIKSKCSVVGPLAVRVCLMEGKLIPSFQWPILNVAMYGCQVTCTQMSKKAKEAVKDKVQLMGGLYTGDFTSRVTHLVCNGTRSEKYVLAAKMGVKVIIPDWIDYIFEASKLSIIRANDPQFLENYNCPPFYNLVICSTGITSTKEKAKLTEIISANGGRATAELLLSGADILVCHGIAGTTSDKYKVARKCGLTCVTLRWIYDSVEKGHALPVEKYYVEAVTSTPTKEGESVDPNFSTISCIGTSTPEVNLSDSSSFCSKSSSTSSSASSRSRSSSSDSSSSSSDNETTRPTKSSPSGLCEQEEEETERNCDLKSHLVRHTEPKEVDLFRCDNCEYRTPIKDNLKRHFLKHSKKADLFRCDKCKFATRYKHSFKNHSLMHKDPEELNLFKCNKCEYQTVNKSNLKQHFLKHQSPEEADLFRCDKCEYRTLRKGDLKKHFLKHESPKKAYLFRCDKCKFATRHKYSFNNHSLRHKDPEELNLFKCNKCEYQTVNKSNLKQHFLKHQSPKKADLFRCDKCVYRTPIKGNLKRHFIKHQSSKKADLFRCDKCKFATRHKYSLKNHSLRHKDPEELNLFKCNKCEYQTVNKSNLKRHFLKHQSAEEVDLF